MTQHRYWYSFDWRVTGKSLMGWCFGETPTDAWRDAMRAATRFDDVEPLLVRMAHCYLQRNCSCEAYDKCALGACEYYTIIEGKISP